MDIIPAHPVSAFTAEIGRYIPPEAMPAHPVSAFTAEIRALYSAGGHARAAGMSHMAV